MKYQTISTREKKWDKPMKSPKDVYELLKDFHNVKKEHFFLITVNKVGIPISMAIIAFGRGNRVCVDVKEIFTRALQDEANTIVVAHNHPPPTTKLDFSDGDIKTTRKIVEAGRILDIPVQDHIIFSGDKYRSSVEDGLFKWLL
jgi:DNA repair protein RadC